MVRALLHAGSAYLNTSTNVPASSAFAGGGGVTTLVQPSLAPRRAAMLSGSGAPSAGPSGGAGALLALTPIGSAAAAAGLGGGGGRDGSGLVPRGPAGHAGSGSVAPTHGALSAAPLGCAPALQKVRHREALRLI